MRNRPVKILAMLVAAAILILLRLKNVAIHHAPEAITFRGKESESQPSDASRNLNKAPKLERKFLESGRGDWNLTELQLDDLSSKGTSLGWCNDLVLFHTQHIERGEVCNTVPAQVDDSLDQMLAKEDMLRALAYDSNGTATFLGQHFQDWWYWYNHARFMNTTGTFVDLATNDAIQRSNTFFLEQCLGWSGVCIEPVQIHHSRIIRDRTCTLVPKAVSNVSGGSAIFQIPSKRTSGSAHFSEAMQWRSQRKFQHAVVALDTLGEIISQQGISHIDFLSLDVEGHELEVLNGIDWANVEIDVIMCENHGVVDFLHARNYRRLVGMFRKGGDAVFVHGEFTLGVERAGLKHVSRWWKPSGRNVERANRGVVDCI